MSERTPERGVAAEIELAGEAAGQPHATPGVDGEGGELAAGRWPPYSADAIATVMAPEGASATLLAIPEPCRDSGRAR